MRKSVAQPVGGGKDAVIPLVELVKEAVHLVDGHGLRVHDDPVHRVLLTVRLPPQLCKHFCHNLPQRKEDTLALHTVRYALCYGAFDDLIEGCLAREGLANKDDSVTKARHLKHLLDLREKGSGSRIQEEYK